MKLLVSVTNALETAAAVEGGADIIDVKNPQEGALGANFPHVIQNVREATPQRIPVSAAIGDVPNLPGMISLAALGAASCGVQYVKVGLFGVQYKNDAIRLLSEICRAVRGYNPRAQIIATAYADAHKFNALPPLDVPEVAIQAGADGCLIDTAAKGEGTLLTNLSKNQLKDFVFQCNDNNLICALAGALMPPDIAAILEINADIIGVRTAACRGDRIKGVIDADKVRELTTLIGAGTSRGSTL